MKNGGWDHDFFANIPALMKLGTGLITSLAQYFQGFVG